MRRLLPFKEQGPSCMLVSFFSSPSLRSWLFLIRLVGDFPLRPHFPKALNGEDSELFYSLPVLLGGHHGWFGADGLRLVLTNLKFQTGQEALGTTGLFSLA